MDARRKERNVRDRMEKSEGVADEGDTTQHDCGGARATGAEAVRASAGLVWPEEEKASGFQKVTGLNFLFEAYIAAE